MFVLTWADQLDRVLTLTQLVNQFGQCQGHAVDFRRPGLCDHGDAQGRIFRFEMFHQDAIGV